MSRRASPLVVGAFVAGAALLALGAVVVLGGGLLFQEKAYFVLFFDGSVKGLSVGAPVVVRGVRVGTVEEVRVEMDPKVLSVCIPVTISVEPDRMVLEEEDEEQLVANFHRWIEQGLRAQLVLQSLVTGQLSVDLDFHPEYAARLSGQSTEYPEIPTVPSSFQRLARTLEELPLQEMVDRAAGTLAAVERLVGSPEAGSAVREARASLREFRRLAADLRERTAPLLDEAGQTLARVRSLAERLDGRVDPLADRADGTLRGAQVFLERLDARVDPALASVRDAARDAGSLARAAERELGPLVAGLTEAGEAAQTALGDASRALSSLQGSVGVDSPVAHDLSAALREISSAARSLRVLTEYLEQRPDALLRGRRGEEGP